MKHEAWGSDNTQHFTQLGPDQVLDAIEKIGPKTTGRCLALNSMENRVYEIEIEVNENSIKSESEKFVVAKFYRPGRWSKEQILEEHQFLKDLKEHEIPGIAPLEFDGQSLFTIDEIGIHFTLFPKKGGRAPEELSPEKWQQLGRLLGRLHAIGSTKKAMHRITLSPETYGDQNIHFLEQNEIIPINYKTSYLTLAKQVVEIGRSLFKGVTNQRLHGDCHKGNILSSDQGFFLVDFDDMVNGPKVQDLWLITPGRGPEDLQQREFLLEGYESMNHFDRRELKLIEPLRALRLIHFAAWIGKRYQDVSFQRAFPHYQTPQYWEGQMHFLREQIGLIGELI